MAEFDSYKITFDQSCDGAIEAAAAKRTLGESKASFLRFLEEMLEALNSHVEEITERLLHGKRPSRIVAVTPDLGDPHNGSKTTVMLTLDTGKILYKPHDLSVDAFAGRIADRFFSGICRIPKVVLCEGSGFAEFIENEPASGPEEAALFFEHLGGSCVLFQIFGSFDLHGKNLLAEKTIPVPIDLETFTRPELGKIKPGAAGIIDDVRRSLYYSGLMPHFIDSERSLLADTDDKAAFLPVVDGKKQSASAYWEDFLRGYRTTYERICGEKKELVAALEGMREVSVRHILRDTTAYTDLFMMLDSEAAKKAGLGGAFLFDLLAKPYLDAGGERFLKLAAEETKAMLRRDYPYFYAKGGSLGIWSEGKELIPDFFGSSSIEACRDRLEAMGKADMEFECELLERALSRTLTPVKRGGGNTEATYYTNIDDNTAVTNERYDTAANSRRKNSLTAAQCIAYAEMIFKQLDADKLVTPSGYPLWLTLNKKRTSAAGFAGRGLIDGSLGIALFFAALSRATGDIEIKERALTLLAGILKPLRQAILEKTEELPDISFASGYAGILFGLERIAQLTGDKECLALCERIIESLCDKELPAKTIDLMGGTAGLLKVICTSDVLWGMRGSRELAIRLAEVLLRAERALLTVSQEKKKRLLSGMAHGQAGIASALRAAYERISDQEAKQQVKQTMEEAYGYEYRIYSEKAGNWPDFRTPGSVGIMLGYCCGAPGIGWDALEQSDAASRENVRRALEAVRREWRDNRGDHLCCGKCASAEFLIKAAAKGKKPEGSNLTGMTGEDSERNRYLAGEILTDLGLRLDRGELLHLGPKGFRDVFVPTLYYGIAGVGYEFLRYAMPKQIPSPLL